MRRPMMLAALAIVALATGIGAAAPAAPKDDAGDAKLTAGSVWNGAIHADSRKANGKAQKASLNVTSRDGHGFEATFTQTGQKQKTLELKGDVDAAGNLRLKPTKIVKGSWGSHVLEKIWVGKVKGEKLSFRIVDDESKPDAQGDEAELTLKS